MNSRGQTLVLFVLLIPVFILLFVLVFNVALLNKEKKKIDNVIKEAVSYGVSNISDSDLENKVNNLISANLSDGETEITINENSINIIYTTSVKNLFSTVSNDRTYEIKSEYTGYIIDNIITIVRR